MEQLQEVFGPLVDARLQEMTQPTVKREAETGTAPPHRSKAARTDQGKGRPGSLAPRSRQRWSKGGSKGQGRTAPPPILGSAEVEADAGGGHRHSSLRTTLLGCLLQMLLTSLKTIGSDSKPPFQAKPEEMKWLMNGTWCYQNWSPALGSLVVDDTRPPLPDGKLMEVIQHALPLTMKHFMIHRFHATRPLASNMTGATTFQFDVSNRTSGDHDGPICPADHWHATPARHTQAVTSSGASAEGLSRNLLIRLLNSSNTCYINASVRAWLFAVHYLSVTDALRYGTQAQAWRDVFYTRRPIHVHALSSWKSVLQDWANLHVQHDACEFLEHILGKGRPPVLQGRWESRLASSTGIETRERHHMHKAITLHLPTPHEPTHLSRLIEH